MLTPASLPLVIYHRADFDGIFSREICKKSMPFAEFLGWDYNDPIPTVAPGRPVYMVDISVEPLMGHDNLIWIDHHISAIDKYPKNIPGLRINGVAACRLCYQWFFGRGDVTELTFEDFAQRKVNEPYAVCLAGEYDVWNHSDSNTLSFQFGLRSEELTSITWGLLLDTHFSQPEVRRLCSAGRAIKYYVEQENEITMATCSFETYFEGLCCLAVNKPTGNSRMFASKLSPRHEALIRYVWKKGKYYVSIYGTPWHNDIDLSLLAAKYGGGGHAHACGFVCDELPFELPTSPNP